MALSSRPAAVSPSTVKPTTHSRSRIVSTTTLRMRLNDQVRHCPGRQAGQKIPLAFAEQHIMVAIVVIPLASERFPVNRLPVNDRLQMDESLYLLWRQSHDVNQ